MTTGRINQVTVVKGADWLLTLERQLKGSEWVSVGKFDRQSTLSSPTWFPSFIVLISNTTLLESKEIYKWIDWNWVFIRRSKEVPPPPLTNPISLVLSLILFWWKWVERILESIDSHLTHPSSHLSRPHSAATTTTFKTSELIDWESHTPINSTHLSLTLFAHKSPFTQSSNSHPPIKDLTKNPEKEIRETQ